MNSRDKLRKERGVNECRHFNGVQHETCKAGIRYDDISRKAAEGITGSFLRLPCLNDTQEWYPCPCLSRLTNEEIKAQDEATEKYVAAFMEKMPKVRAAIIEHLKQAGQMKVHATGKIPCPSCGTGEVSFSRAGHYNGHVWAKCSTDDCVAWQE